MSRFLFITCLLLGLASAAPAVDLATLDGRRYQEAEVTWFYEDAVIVRYEGVKYARLPLVRLRPESLIALGFPPPVEDEPTDGMEEGMDAVGIPTAPPQRTPRLRPVGAAPRAPANTTSRGAQREAPAEAEMETEGRPKPKMTPRAQRKEGMTKPKKQKKAEAPKPPENPFGALLD
ncbi:MAG: hypothetical protein ACI8W8_002609, partial [Rhodothermales bacterium]